MAISSTFATLVLLFCIPGLQAQSRNTCEVSFENFTPPTTTEAITGKPLYPRGGDTIYGTLILTNPTNDSFSYSSVNVDLTTKTPDGNSYVESPFHQNFPAPYRTIGPGEVHRFQFSLKTNEDLSGNYMLLGSVSFVRYGFGDRGGLQSIPNDYSKSTKLYYYFEPDSTKRNSLLDAWNKLSGIAKALWLAFAGFIGWLLFKGYQITKMDQAVESLMKTGKEIPAKTNLDEDLVDAGGEQPKIVRLPGGELCFKAKLDLCTDGIGPKAAKEKTHLSTTAMGAIDADKTNYIVLSGNYDKNDAKDTDRGPLWYKQFGIEKGDVALMLYRGKMTGAIFAEVGPRKKLGEASVSALDTVGGVKRTAAGQVVNTGTPHAATIIVFPGSGDLFPRGRPNRVPAGTPVEKTNFPTNAEINALTFGLAKKFGFSPPGWQ